MLARYEKELATVEAQYDDGEITQEERHEAVTGLWDRATNEVGEALYAHLDEMNPIFMMANSGARGSFSQIRQLAGMRGLMANPKGEIIERPIKANFMEGLSVLEYFISTHGARKGLADTALRTADSGYLTRRLVDVAQDVVIREEECGTHESIAQPMHSDNREEHLLGRLLGEPVADPETGEIVFERDTEVTKKVLRELDLLFPKDKHPEQKIRVRSVLVCESEFGVCQHCYGRSLATSELVSLGEAVGHIAAQSIGEPGTQLTMRTFHTGGVAGADITHGLPRVVELFEARKPKGQARIVDAELDPEREYVARVEEDDKGRTVTIEDEAGLEVHSYNVSRRQRLLVKEGQRIQSGDQLYEGSMNPHDLLQYLS